MPNSVASLPATAISPNRSATRASLPVVVLVDVLEGHRDELPHQLANPLAGDIALDQLADKGQARRPVKGRGGGC